jgi:hypothetical protein
MKKYKMAGIEHYSYDPECEGCKDKIPNRISVCAKEFRIKKDLKCPCGECIVKITCVVGCKKRSDWVRINMI